MNDHAKKYEIAGLNLKALVHLQHAKDIFLEVADYETAAKILDILKSKELENFGEHLDKFGKPETAINIPKEWSKVHEQHRIL